MPAGGYDIGASLALSASSGANNSGSTSNRGGGGTKYGTSAKSTGFTAGLILCAVVIVVWIFKGH